MTWLADVVAAIAGALLLVVTLPGRPARGESFVGAHLVTGPIALVFCAGAALALWTSPLAPASAWTGALAVLLAPGVVVGLTFLPLLAYGGRHARRVKAVMPVVAAAPFAIGHGGAVHAVLPWLGAVALAAVGAGGTWVLAEHPLRRLRARIAAALRTGPREPSAWEREQADWQRGEWAKVPAGADVAALLPHARSLAPDVRAACLQRLAAHPDLDHSLAAALADPEPAAALWYLAHGYPRSLAPFAAPLSQLLARLRATWPERLRSDPHPRPWTGDLVPALECAVAVLLAGGDVRAELNAWQRELATMPKLASVAKDLGRWLRRAG